MKPILIILAFFLAACGGGYKHTTIRDESPGRKVQIEYRGAISFTANGQAIRSMQPGGRAVYTLNGERFEARADENGRIVYAFNSGEFKKSLSGTERLFMQAAIRDMARLAARMPKETRAR